jgi:arylsulfatase A-like enzyme
MVPPAKKKTHESEHRVGASLVVVLDVLLSLQHPFESDVHIPLLARGPGIAAGTRVTSLVSNIDIAPTFIDIAGLPANPEQDGSSLLPLLTTAENSPERIAAEATWRTSLMIR